ncbi:uncharacterized protein LOC108914280 [Anoplophora glabripennis]|uniref:uncharacterized protein LOC108914280 n=1 Tax=Anoplophora glabripennis TaxID=217634 RepID=UPI00087447FC|nr:uncharacterized protein LOC108914280 [Anoplophora glabripennis]
MALLQKYGIMPGYIANYHAQANPVERVHYVIKTILTSYVADNHRSWNKYLAHVGCAIRSSRHETTKLTPNFVMFGIEIQLSGADHHPLTNLTEELDTSEYDVQLSSEALKVFKDVSKRLKEAYERSVESSTIEATSLGQTSFGVPRRGSPTSPFSDRLRTLRSSIAYDKVTNQHHPVVSEIGKPQHSVQRESRTPWMTPSAINVPRSDAVEQESCRGEISIRHGAQRGARTLSEAHSGVIEHEAADSDQRGLNGADAIGQSLRRRWSASDGIYRPQRLDHSKKNGGILATYKQQSQFNKAIKKGEKVDPETWKLYNVARCFYSSDDFEKICGKLKECEITSDIQSDVDDNATSVRVRNRIPNRKYIEVASDEDDNISESQLIRPPRIARKLDNPSPCTSRSSSSILTSQTIKENLCPGNKNILFHRTGDTTLSTDKENIEKLIQLQERNIELLMHIKEQNKQILATISKQEKTREKSSLPDLPVKFPVDTNNNLKILDEILRENTEIADCLCSYLSSLGGKDATNRTNRILKYILSDEVAKNYNFYGKRTEKEAFCHLTLCSIIVQSVKISHSGTSDKDVEDIIKVWLKHAPERIRNCERRLNKHASQT